MGLGAEITTVKKNFKKYSGRTVNRTGTVGMTASISRDASKIWDAKVGKSETA